jgi:uncharacterized membrane protein YfcA
MKAFFFAVPIAVLGGLIGLGGAEFRLPVLMRVFRYHVKHAVPINLAISLVTVVSAFTIRITAASLESIAPLVPLLILFGSTSMAGAYIGTGYLQRLHDASVERIVVLLLIVIGALLVAESLTGFNSHRVTDGMILTAVVAAGLGMTIGIFSSLLGVAGGELIIPSLVLIFGVGVKEAGTASLLISSVTIAVGLLRYWRQGRYHGYHDLTGIMAPMGLGSLIGSMLGAAMIGVVSAEVLKGILGLVLIFSSLKMLSGSSPLPAPAT